MRDSKTTASPTAGAVTPATAGGRTGAVAAPLLLIAAVMAPVTIASLKSPTILAWWGVILFFTLPWALVAALLGYFVGRVAARFDSIWLGACVGAACSLPITVIYSFFFITRAEAVQTHVELKIMLLVGSIGIVTGALAWRAAYHNRHRDHLRVFQFSISEMVLVVAAIAAYLSSLIV